MNKLALVPINKELANIVADHGERLLTRPEVAKLLRKSEKTIGRWIRSKRLPHLKFDYGVLFPERDIVMWYRRIYGRNLEQ